ncbi:hypothetical protein [Actinacidiphila soli]|uniref:hypothetical protein n=1 Tax=Actinacidiphila soli TaxID=2487275 RepID=UPI000FC9FB1E|nr:hypothetical protein [Actinacidiphila soli]
MTQNHSRQPDTGTRPTAPDEGGPEARLSLLESQVATLAEAIRALAQGLEKIPSQDVPLAEEAARGARLAHELLLSQDL